MVSSAAATPEAYLAELDDDWRKVTLLALRALIHQHAPHWQEGMAYKMLGYRHTAGDDDDPVMCLNAQKQYVSLYVGNAHTIDPDGSLLRGLDVGKGCIRFKRKHAVEDTQIDAFIARAVKLHGEGVDIGC